MPRPCSICHHQAKPQIEADLAQEVSYRTIETRYTPKVSKASLSRHHLAHMPEKPSDAVQTPEPVVEPRETMPAVIEAAPLTSPLSAEEADVLAHHEAVIARGLKSFVEVGLALMEIKERKLYRGAYTTFEQYLDQRWHVGTSHGYRLIEAAEVMRSLSPIGDKLPLPTNEAQARELAAVPKEARQEVWETAVQTAPKGKVTASHVKTVVTRRLGKPTGKGSSAHPKVTPRKPRRVQVQELLYQALTLMGDDEAMALLREFWAGVRSLVAIKGAKDPVKAEQITKLLAEVGPLLEGTEEA
jgi:hypothetical protein